MSSSILVRDYMDHNPHAIPQHFNAREAVESLLQSGVHGAPVIDSQHRLVGFISEQDCIKDLLNDTFYCGEPSPLEKLMRREVITVKPETSIVELAEQMSEKRPKNYPVIDDSKKLVGLINRRHILRALLENARDCYIK